MSWGDEAAKILKEALDWAKEHWKATGRDPYAISFDDPHEACSREITKLLRDAMCENQKDLAQYSFLLSKKHRDLKDQIRDDPHDLDAIFEYFTVLLDFGSEGMAAADDRNITHMLSYFKVATGKRNTSLQPRICLKTHVSPHVVDADPEIVVVRRDHDVSYDRLSRAFRAHANSGIAFVFHNGRQYHQDNIPAEVRAGRYANPRLDRTEALRYLDARSTKVENPDALDQPWTNCWDRGINQQDSALMPDQRNCYKSTLIVPLTLRNQRLRTEYTESFRLNEVGRSIYGYLCFDHARTQFFQETDENVGYIFADILSLYWLAYITYTQASKTFWKAVELLSSDPKYGADCRVLALSEQRVLALARGPETPPGNLE